MAPKDRSEPTTIVEPLIPEEASKHRSMLNDLVLELVDASASLRGAIPPSMRAPLADTIRAMNCYYSNLIEGHHTHPIDIERALQDDFSQEPEKRDLQLEARAHIHVQAWIDAGGLNEHPMSISSLTEIHRRFCHDLPEDLLLVDAPDGSKLTITPGVLRDRDVQVGKHVAPSPGAVTRLIAHMEKMYSMPGRVTGVLGIACAHHRLNWVHPFLDLNGRVTRMVAHAMLLRELQTDGLWSISRGLARNEEEYKRRLMAADEPRHGGADGRGNLSETRLAEFAAFFLKTCIDQVHFMERLMRPEDLRARILGWAEREIAKGGLMPGSDLVLREALFVGAIERSALPRLLGVGERQARKISSELLKRGALKSQSPRASLELNFSPRLASEWMPGLFPEA